MWQKCAYCGEEKSVSYRFLGASPYTFACGDCVDKWNLQVFSDFDLSKSEIGKTNNFPVAKPEFGTCFDCGNIESPNHLYPYEGHDLCWNCYGRPTTPKPKPSEIIKNPVVISELKPKVEESIEKPKRRILLDKL